LDLAHARLGEIAKEQKKKNKCQLSAALCFSKQDPPKQRANDWPDIDLYKAAGAEERGWVLINLYQGPKENEE